MASTVTLLFTSTLRSYLESLSESWKGVRRNWYWSLMPVAYLPVVALGGIVSRPLGVLGGFLMGFVVLALVANYLAIVAHAVRGEGLAWREVWPETVRLFWPVMGGLFVLFGVSLVASLALRDKPLLAGVLSLVLVVIFNPLPEVIYQRGAGGVESFQEALEFMKENAVEWLLANVILLSPVLLVGRLSIFDVLTAGDPFRALGTVLGAFSSLTIGPLGMVSLPLMLFVGFYVIVVRGVLFYKLSHSSRRKRIYEERLR